MRRLRVQKCERRWRLQMRRHERRTRGAGHHRHYWRVALVNTMRAGHTPTTFGGDLGKVDVALLPIGARVLVIEKPAEWPCYNGPPDGRAEWILEGGAPAYWCRGNPANSMLDSDWYSMALKEALDELREITTQLNAETDRLNATICDFEEELERIGVGVAVWLPGPLGDNHCLSLGYKRIGERWRVAVCPVGPDKLLDVARAVPLTSAPRAARVLAVDRFEELTRALIAQAKTYMQAMSISMEELRGGQQHNTTRKRDT